MVREGTKSEKYRPNPSSSTRAAMRSASIFTFIEIFFLSILRTALMGGWERNGYIEIKHRPHKNSYRHQRAWTQTIQRRSHSYQ